MSIMQTYSGVAWDLLNPHHSNIFLCDILTSLERIYRFNGHTRRPLSVLKHSLLVAKLASEEAKPWALLHDVHEAYLGDMTTPVAQAVASHFDGVAIGRHNFSYLWDRLKLRHDGEIWKAFGLQPPCWKVVKEVKRADYEALAGEKEYLLYSQRDESVDIWGGLPKPCSKRKVNHRYQIDGATARKKFINACEKYGMQLPPMYPQGFEPEARYANG